MNKNSKLVITGIGTDVGKTVVSSIIAEALKASYWKPIQAGDLDNSDSIKVDRFTDNVTVLPEAFRLSEPMSPHAAAEIDGVEIAKDDLDLPEVGGNLIIEGAGGIMVPVNSNGLTFADIIERWNLPTIVVSRHYLGSINHTLLTLEVLQSRGVTIEGLVFVGAENKATEEIILKSTGVKFLARIPMAKELNKTFVLEQAESIISLL
ncbi:dethiobiotin synthase [Crocinitomicaceae bacterium]|mgnify:CR=1 FL=1|jgi:dethiobiotin synthetase|nr:dethiobiotin synthase [Crocinitomicaceae bacterium]MDC1282865.1 dethiobiotin synthase [Crocinitomicaceae bacterium]|tara:strand:- start:20223 stop:20843 length:621 start_codon:yes stop_codon:yes gene_type:complete